MLAPGRLPEKQYYRGATLGNGAYGSVSVVFDDDGNEYAGKTFWEEEAEGDGDWDDDGEWDDCSSAGIDGGILREIAMLRLLNGAHPNVMSMVDVSRVDKGGIALVLPKMSGDLTHAISTQKLSNKDKMKIAALSLHGLAFMHEHGIIHRDIKPDNLLLDADGAPVLADLSLAKVVGAKAQVTPEINEGGKKKRKRGKKRKKMGAVGGDGEEDSGVALTESMGTPTYRAPEIVNGESYGVKADVFSLGVVFLELFTGAELNAWKDKHALALLAEKREKLKDDKPIPKLLKAMLDFDPEQRVSAAEALAMLPALDKMGIVPPTAGEVYLPPPPVSATELPVAEASKGGGRPTKRAKGGSGSAKDADTLSASRICKLMEATNPQTAQDAEHLWKRSDAAQKAGVAGAAACALIAFKISEIEMWKPDDLYELKEIEGTNFDASEYSALELEILGSVGYGIISCTACEVTPMAVAPLRERQVQAV